MTSDFLHVPLNVLPADSGCVIDCDTCAVRGDACPDCVVAVMLGGPPDALGAEEQRALDVLAGAGLVPPLQMTPPAPPAATPPRPGPGTPPPAPSRPGPGGRSGAPAPGTPGPGPGRPGPAGSARS